MLTFDYVAQTPDEFYETLTTRTNEQFILRPLLADDVADLTTFLQNLSPETRHLSSFGSYDREQAQELCDAIAKYDKLRFVIQHPSDQIIALLEFSFAITDGDLERYAAHGITLDPKTDCRFGPTITDDYQDKGLGSLAMPFIKSIAERFEQQRIILWGGVLVDNLRAIHFYEKHGFIRTGEYQRNDGATNLDMILQL